MKIRCATVAAVLLVAGCSSPPPSEPLTTESMLSMMYGGSENAIGSSLDRADRNCSESRDRIGDYVSFVIGELDERKPGHEEDAQTIASAIARAVGDAGGAECAGIIAAMLVLMLPAGS